MKETYGYLLIVIASIIWGTMGIFGKFAFAYGISPITLTAFRILISSFTILVPITLLKRELLNVKRKDLPRLFVFGLFGVAFQRIAYFYAVELTTATLAAILFYTYPIFVTIYASMFLKEKATKSALFATVLAFFGVALIVRAYEISWVSTNLLGIVSGTLAGILFAVYFLMTKKLRDTYTNWTLLVYGDGIGALALTPVIWLSIPEISVYPQQLWTLIAIIALFPSLTAYLLFSYALKHVESAKGSVLSVTEPLSAALFSVTILGETFEPLQIIGVALALIGITLLFYKPNR
jgi:drug/metabolite transporter (DMT)-like permease